MLCRRRRALGELLLLLLHPPMQPADWLRPLHSHFTWTDEGGAVFFSYPFSVSAIGPAPSSYRVQAHVGSRFVDREAAFRWV